ncbi:MAG: DJ-1/PfpI family protein [Anaerotruncus sp.]|nr:MAG: DJ-1/PfpI family protein [Anaerotruncus sp.]
MIYVFLANGFEITEAMAPVDMMRRAKLDVKTVGIGDDVIESSCGVKVVADIREKDVDMNNAEAVVVPGGMPGVTNLDASDFVKKTAFARQMMRASLFCAICAGPSVPGKLGVLAGKKSRMLSRI